jgi:farnesyl diphosphate synthase/geranylgeranyl diphosphate synthase type II
MHYATVLGGKRMRPLLVYAAGQSFGATFENLDRPAIAIELIHAYSLVHDDLPAMDNDLLRRGQPTCHVAYGEALAILAGDAMQALAFEILANASQLNALAMIKTLAEACGLDGMAGGQAQDLAVVGQSINELQLQAVHRDKTGKLIKAAIILGAQASPTAITKKRWLMLEQLGLQLGLAYQIQDDIFDVEIPTEQRGKQQGADAALNKPTYPALLGLAGAKARLNEVCEHIDQTLQQLELIQSPLAATIHHILHREI